MKTLTKYANDNFISPTPVVNYSGVFNVVNETAIRLINTTRDVYVDEGGEYSYEAVSYDGFGNVFFMKAYLERNPA